MDNDTKNKIRFLTDKDGSSFKTFLFNNEIQMGQSTVYRVGQVWVEINGSGIGVRCSILRGTKQQAGTTHFATLPSTPQKARNREGNIYYDDIAPIGMSREQVQTLKDDIVLKFIEECKAGNIHKLKDMAGSASERLTDEAKAKPAEQPAAGAEKSLTDGAVQQQAAAAETAKEQPSGAGPNESEEIQVEDTAEAGKE